MTRLSQLGADVRAAAVLPDDGLSDGPAAARVPQHGGLALVGDADGRDVARPQFRLLHGVDHRAQGHGPYLIRVMLYQSRLREILLEFVIDLGEGAPVGVEYHAGTAGRPLVDG